MLHLHPTGRYDIAHLPKVIEFTKQAKDRISDRDRWCQKHWGRMKNGTCPVGPSSPDQCCSYGSLIVTFDPRGEFGHPIPAGRMSDHDRELQMEMAEHYLSLSAAKFFGKGTYISANDLMDHADVMVMWARAIEMMEEDLKAAS
jgi:hypothetical protein